MLYIALQLQAAIPEGVSSSDIRHSRAADTEYSDAAVTNSTTLTVPAAATSTSLVAVTAPDVYSASSGAAYSCTADDSVPPLVHGGADSDFSPNDNSAFATTTSTHGYMAAPTSSIALLVAVLAVVITPA